MYRIMIIEDNEKIRDELAANFLSGYMLQNLQIHFQNFIGLG